MPGVANTRFQGLTETRNTSALVAVNTAVASHKAVFLVEFLGRQQQLTVVALSLCTTCLQEGQDHNGKVYRSGNRSDG